MITTRKIELWIDNDDKEKRNETWTYLRGLGRDVYRASNLIMSHQWFNEEFTNRIMKNDEYTQNKERIDNISKEIHNEKNKNKKNKLESKRKKLYDYEKKLKSEAREKAEELYLTGQQNTTYQLLGKEFPEMPSYVKGSINNEVYNAFKKDIFDVRQGKKTLRNYKNGMPIPFMRQAMKFEKNDNGDMKLNWLNGIVFKLRFGRGDKSSEEWINNETAVIKAMDGEYKISDSKIKIENKKIFLLLAIDIPYKHKKLNNEICVGVDLGLTVPACCALSDGYKREFLGDRNSLLKVRLQMQSRRKKLQAALRLNTGGKGRRQKLKALDKLRDEERNYVKTYNHKISSEIISFAENNCAGTIKLEFLEGFSENEKNNFVLRNWSYFELQSMIQYKAERAGIKVIFVDPYHTSQTCAKCGHYEDGQREKQSEFCCKNIKCTNKIKDGNDKGKNKTINADYNAALNIAKSDKIVTKKEECEYYKREQLRKEEMLVLQD